jgi:hypothetical protein
VPNNGETRTPMSSPWPKVPVDPGFRKWLTVEFTRTVLVVVRTITTLSRLLDIVAVLEKDHRLQVIFTRDEGRPAIFSAGVDEFLRKLQVPVISWEQATCTRFDLAIAASENDALQELDAPVVLLSHGIGFQKYYPGTQIVAGMDPARLVDAGKVIPAMIALSHHAQREQLRAASPEAVGRSAVIGDPSLDRLIASRHRAPGYHAALQAQGKTLVVLASTWGPKSLFGTWPQLAEQLLTELEADRFQLAAILHPGVWSAHSPHQVRAWFSGARRAGLILIPFEESWRATLIAADIVVSDFGSIPLYAAALDKPLLLATDPSETTVADSPMEAMTSRVARLDPTRPLAQQIIAACHGHTPGIHEPIIKQAVEHVGESASLTRTLLYKLMNLPEPSDPPAFDPVPDPEFDRVHIGAYIVGGRLSNEIFSVVRFPAPHDALDLDYTHVAADIHHATLQQLEGASVLYVTTSDDTAAALRLWRGAILTATAIGRSCLIHTRNGDSFTLTAASGIFDPLVLSSLVYVEIIRGRNLNQPTKIAVGERVFDVTVTYQVHEDSGRRSDG